jgi:hypothetical protein
MVFLKINQIILQDEKLNLHKLVKVKDTLFDSAKKMHVSNWLWIYEESSMFFNFEIWEELDNAYLNKVIWYKNTYFKVIKINKNSQVRYS